MEEAIAQYYAARVSFPEALREEIRAMTADAMRENHGLSDEVRDQYTRRLETLDKKESYLLDLAAEEGRPKERLRDKIREIRVERSNIEQCMTDTEQEQFASGRHLLDQALDLLDRPAERYVDGNETVRTLMNRAIFARFVVDGTKVINGELKAPFDALIGAAERDEVRVYLPGGVGRPVPAGWRRPAAADRGGPAAVVGELREGELARGADPPL